MRVPLDGELVEAEKLQFEVSSDAAAEVMLADGTRFRVKTVVEEVYRTERVDEEGHPVYVLKINDIVVGQPPGDVAGGEDDGNGHSLVGAASGSRKS